jgi:hypothetical protein
MGLFAASSTSASLQLDKFKAMPCSPSLWRTSHFVTGGSTCDVGGAAQWDRVPMPCTQVLWYLRASHRPDLDGRIFIGADWLWTVLIHHLQDSKQKGARRPPRLASLRGGL